MTRGRWTFALAGAALLALVAGGLWYFESPAWTLKGMKDAAEAHDADTLNAYVDYPALRESLRSQLVARIVSDARKGKSGLGALGISLGSIVVGPMVDRLISPAGMRAALLASRQDNASDGSPLRVPKNPVIVRRGWSEFLLTTKDRPDRGLIFSRHGLSWKLSGVQLPPDASD